MSTFTTPANTSASDKKKRDKELELNREMYDFDQNYLPPISTLKLHRAPGQEGLEGLAPTEPPTGAQIMLPPELLQTVLSAANADTAEDEMVRSVSAIAEKAANEIGHLAEEGLEGLGDLFGTNKVEYDESTGVPKQEVPPTLSYLIPRGINGALSDRGRKKLLANPPRLGKPSDYQAYLKEFSNIDKFNGYQQITSLWNNDVIFGWQRLAGVNPRVIQALTQAKLGPLLAKMPLKDEHVSAVAGTGSTMAGEIAANRLYFCDYALLDKLPKQPGRLMYPCIGVFWSNASGEQLLPLAIQFTQTPDRVRTPADADWEISRLHFQVADFNYHEMGTHLSEAHFAQEAFVVAARRNFPAEHPIGAFLFQIYFALLYNNTLGRMQLVNPGGFVEKMMAGELQDGSLAIVRDYYSKVWTWDDWNLENYLTRQGVTDTTALPNYPYRDDGLPLFKAIQRFTADYVAAWYGSDGDVAADDRIAGWVEDLVSPTKGNVGGKGFPSTITSRGDLAEVLARLTWQASAGHGAINYSQYQYFAWVPNAPGAAYAEKGAIMDALPLSTPTAYQQSILNVLTFKIFGRLGEYDHSFMKGLNPDAKGAVASFQAQLAKLSEAVAQRNARFPRSALNYPWLDPKQLPNSTNI